MTEDPIDTLGAFEGTEQQQQTNDLQGWDQVQAMLRSRKFWAMVTAIVAASAGLATNQIDTWQFIIAVVAAMGAYSTGVAIEDAGAKIGGK